MVNFSLEGKVALVTGASYGIGFAIATAFAEAGARIAFNDIRQELVDKGLASYREKGIDAKGYVCDVTREDQVRALVAAVEKDLGPINILVNNAGIIKRIPMTEMKAEEFRQVIDVEDHQHLFHDVRTRTGDGFRLCSGKGRPQDADKEHSVRVR